MKGGGGDKRSDFHLIIRSNKGEDEPDRQETAHS